MDAKEIAYAYINNDMAKIYALNRSFSIGDAVKQAHGMLDGIDFTVWNEETVKRILVEQPDLMPYYPPERAVKRGIDLAYGKKQITASVTSGILQGQSIDKMAAHLMQEVTEMNRASAVRAARTATTAAENAGRQDAAEELAAKGVIQEKMWRAVHDSRTRDVHMEADGQTVPFDEPFIVGGEELMFPGDGSMGASGWNIYNCRCGRQTKIVGFKSVLTEEQRKRANIRVVKS